MVVELMPVSRAPFVVASSNITPHGVPTMEEGNRREVGNGRKGEVIEAPLNYGRCRVRSVMRSRNAVHPFPTICFV